MSELVTVLAEPGLEFRFGQALEDPREGLALFGPYDADLPSRPGNLAYGVVGTQEGITAFRAFAERITHAVLPADEDESLLLWKAFPGYEAAFGATWPTVPAWEAGLDRAALLQAARKGDPHLRAHAVVTMYVDALRLARDRDEKLAVAYCIVPETVYINCRPQSYVRERVDQAPSPKEKLLRTKGQQDAFGEWDPVQYNLSVDFRRQLKARAMEFGIPVQIIRETTLRLTPPKGTIDERDLTPLSDRAWNLATTTYYKAGGKPWRLSTARGGVCYIGLAFRRSDPDVGKGTACCAAQMFLDSGDGVVFKGEYGPWYSEERREFHLSREAARDLLAGVLHTYSKWGGKPLKEVFLHSRSSIDREEFEGYLEAVSGDVIVVGIRVRPERGEGIKLFRPGTRPVIRGTLWVTSDRAALLWGSGFIPKLRTYPGWEVPVPLRVDIQHGEADIEQVARDILGLTKLNYNACRVGDSQPVTIGFSDAVGEILIANPGSKEAHPQFRFYI